MKTSTEARAIEFGEYIVESGEEIRNLKIHSAYGSNKMEQFCWRMK